MQKTKTVVRKRVEGQVAFNNGEFAEIEINGSEGVEKGLFLETIQINPEDSKDVCRLEFQQRFPVGMLLDISTTIEVTEHMGPLTACEESNAQ